jgi:hypothetical protein
MTLKNSCSIQRKHGSVSFVKQLILCQLNSVFFRRKINATCWKSLRRARLILQLRRRRKVSFSTASTSVAVWTRSFSINLVFKQSKRPLVMSSNV